MSSRRARTPTGPELEAVAGLSGRLRNVCVMGHVDHGKSSLVDWLIAENGVIPQRLAGQLRYMDDTAEEQARGITMRASAVSILYSHQGLRPRWSEEGEDKRYAVTLIDTPGHIDFSSDASAATRLCDGCVVVVDAVEGLRIQSHAALRNACLEKSRPVLFVNKLDRLANEQVSTSTEAWERLCRLIESANASMHGALSAVVTDPEERERLIESWRFSPEAGNVIFGSALQGWGFTLPQLAGVLAPALKVQRKALLNVLFGEYSWVDGKVVRYSRTKNPEREPIFADLVLEPLCAVAGGVKSVNELAELLLSKHPLLEALAIKAKTPEEGRVALSKALPVAQATLRAVVLCVPPPSVAQRERRSVLLPFCLGEDDEEAAKIAEAVAGCEQDAERTVVYVSKLALLGSANQELHSRVYALCRVFCGTVTPGDELRVVKEGAEDEEVYCRVASVYSMIGSSLVTLSTARAGQVVALGPEVANVMRCKRATLTWGVVVSMAPRSSVRFAQQQQPVVRVAVDVARQADAEALDRGLVLLNQLSASASVELSASGERIVGAVGELHLESCLKDLSEQYACCELKVSKPIIGFRESCFLDEQGGHVPPPWSDEIEEEEAAIRCVAMPQSLARALCASNADLTAAELVKSVLALDKEARGDVEAHKLLAAMLPGAVVGVGPPSARGCLLVDVTNEANVTIIKGFEMACSSGPLAEEPMHAVVFILDDATDLLSKEDPAATMLATKRACRSALLRAKCRLYEATLHCELHCSGEHLGSLYGLLAKRRGKVLDEVDQVEGTDVFVVSASIPARDALGFGKELLKWTSGAATAPQMRFDDFQPCDDDPFWRPTTLEEREEHGEVQLQHNYSRTFINEVRTRKGLPTEIQVIGSAEKQRSRAGIKG